MTILIDGTSGSGKSTIGTRLAKEYNLPFADTGLIYRGITYYAIEKNISPNEIEKLKSAIGNNHLSFDFDDELAIYVDGEKLSYEKLHDEIRISPKVSEYAGIFEISHLVMEIEKTLASKGCVMVGRNLGNEVMPDADIIFFVDTAPAIRAVRRYKDVKGSITLQEILLGLIKRDYSDISREVTPLFLTQRHIIIDNSGDFEEVISTCKRFIESNLRKIELHKM